LITQTTTTTWILSGYKTLQISIQRGISCNEITIFTTKRSTLHGDTMSFDLVLFGGTGDLAWRKLMPALFQAFRHGTLPTGAHHCRGAGRPERRTVPQPDPVTL
jgi:hypothetical protein